MSERIETYGEFFLYYLREHARPTTRALHYLAAFSALGVLMYGLIFGPLWIALLMPVAGYGPAWIAHFFIEKNRPATFTYPGWSLISDYVMTALWLTGKLGRWLDKAGVPHKGRMAAQR
ncbi:membrane protein [Iodidimonas gelatinilytica]|uniref:Membrane protein n=1 Tax=Iodidimonas gelatinilytica TaxID=1236966 RepID=A0A5A7MUP1_9PROT|nr:DUF962 domain-containing protein [Iodidimonas gelatinilytica]GEQ99043.1 membrane protein [Iodidimonas gelatinilytica]GER00773.1 membrane protein [Iodidimonas gelatinilytica]